MTLSSMKRVSSVLTTLAVAAFATPAAAQKIGDPAEANNMRLVGFNDLQARSAYQPTIHKQGERYIAYIGHHGASYVPKAGEFGHRSSRIQRHVDRRRHQPGAAEISGAYSGREGGPEIGGAQMTRICDGKSLPKADRERGLSVAYVRPAGARDLECRRPGEAGARDPHRWKLQGHP